MGTGAASTTIHLPWGFLPVGKRVRAACSCGFRTTPRVDQSRAQDALLSEHGFTRPVCQLCDADHEGHSWLELRTRYVEIVTDPATGEQFLACRGMPRSCSDAARQKQLHLDQSVAAAFGIELPRPSLRLIHGG